MNFLENEVRQYTDFVWSSILEAETQLFHGKFDLHQEGNAIGSVQITGAWKGLVVLCLNRELANQVTEKMFLLEKGKTTHHEISDAVGELTNMIGGNIKALLPQPSCLSVPIVVLNGQHIQFPCTKTVGQNVFESNGQPFMISILKSVDKPFLRKKLKTLATGQAM